MLMRVRRARGRGREPSARVRGRVHRRSVKCQPQASSHEQGGRDERQRYRLAQDNQGRRAPTNGGGREVRPVRAEPRCRNPRMNSTRLNAVTNQSKHAGPREAARQRPGCSEHASHGDVRGAGHEPLDRRNLHRIGTRDFAREIIVERPTRGTRPQSPPVRTGRLANPAPTPARRTTRARVRRPRS